MHCFPLVNIGYKREKNTSLKVIEPLIGLLVYHSPSLVYQILLEHQVREHCSSIFHIKRREQSWEWSERDNSGEGEEKGPAV